MRSSLSLLAVAACAALLAACSSTPVATTDAAKPAATTAATPATTPSASSRPAPASTVTSVVLPAHLDPKNPVSLQRSVYFDFDEAVIKKEYADVITLHGKYLIPNQVLSIRIEGNTDERGSAEYNLALGQKRAEAVQNALKLYGVKDKQMEAVSYGSERPKASGHDEAAWAENRRADLVYPKQ